MGNFAKVTKRSLLETDKSCFPPDGVLDKVFSLLSNARQRFSVEFVGDDANKPNLLIESNIVNKNLQIITINGDERGDIAFNNGVVVLDETDDNTSLKKIFKRHVITENTSADHLTTKKKKSDPGNEEQDVYIAKVKLDFKPKRKFKFYRKKNM